MQESGSNKVSRQRRWQIKMISQGRCCICGKLADASKIHCFYHAKKDSNRALRKRGIVARRYNTKYGKSLELV